MDHSFFTDRLSALYDMELKHEEQVIVQAHVDECEECQAILKRFEQFDSFANENSQLGDDAYWEAQAQKIEASLAPAQTTKIIEVRKKSSSGIWWKLTAAAASIAVLTFIGFYESDITDKIDTAPSVVPEQQEALPPTDSNTTGRTLKDAVADEDDSAVQSSERVEGIKPPTTGGAVDELKEENTKTQMETSTEKLAEEAPPVSKGIPKKTTADEGISIEPVVKTVESDKVKSDGITDSYVQSAPAPAQRTKTVSKKTTSAEEQKTVVLAPDSLKTVLRKVEFKNDGIDLAAQAVKPLSLAAEATTDSVTANEDSLTYWRTRRDSLLAQTETSAKRGKKTTFAVGDTEASTVKLTEELLESYYQIVLLTTDSTERLETITKLELVKSDKSSPLAKKAALYLKQLKKADKY